MLGVNRRGRWGEPERGDAPALEGTARLLHGTRLRPRAELMDHLLRRQPLLAAVELAVAGLVAVMLGRDAAASALASWLAVVLLTQTVRMATHARFSRPVGGPANVLQLARWLTWSSLSAGLA